MPTESYKLNSATGSARKQDFEVFIHFIPFIPVKTSMHLLSLFWLARRFLRIRYC